MAAFYKLRSTLCNNDCFAMKNTSLAILPLNSYLAEQKKTEPNLFNEFLSHHTYRIIAFSVENTLNYIVRIFKIYLFNLFFIMLFIFSVVQLQLSLYPPYYSPLPYRSPTSDSHSSLSPNPLSVSMGPLYMFLDLTLPLLCPVIPLPSPLLTVSLFFISMSLVLFSLLLCFVDYVPLIGEVISYWSFTAWLISLNIMLSSSLHALVKGRSSFFLFAVENSIV